MKKLMVLLAMVSLVAVNGCYRPSWYRANTTYAQLKTDSNWCKSQTNIGSTRAELIDQYEGCMRNKGYELKDRSDSSSGGESTIKVEQNDGPPIVIDRNTKVYIGVNVTAGGMHLLPAYRYFHKKDCKHIWNVSTEEVRAGEAIARGKSMCPDCFKD